MEQYVETFLTARAADGCTKKTLIWHRSALNRFIAWAKDAGVPDDPDQWTAHHLRSYIVALQDSALTPTSVATYVRSLRAFITWMFEEELIEKNLSAKVKAPRAPILQKQPFSNSELKLILGACATHRDKAILALLVDCGLRANELCTLTRSNVLLDQRLLLVMGKGNKQRVIPFSTRTALILRKHLLKHDGENVFTGRSQAQLTPNGLLQLIMRLGERAQVENVYPHRFRHTFAISYLRNGGDPLTLQRLLGHTTLTMTNHYVNTATTDLQRSHDLASPLMKLFAVK